MWTTWGVISPDRALVQRTLAEMETEFGNNRLALQPGELFSDEATCVGTKLDLKALCSTLTKKRYQMLKGSLRAVSRRKRLSGQLLEIVIGHCTFGGLACRPLLSIFHAVYKFIHKH